MENVNEPDQDRKTFNEEERINAAITELSSKWLFRWRRYRDKLKKFTWDLTLNFSRFLKRLLDIVFSIIFLVSFSPIFFVTAIAIKIEDSEGAIFFNQPRVGKDGKLFLVYKFRSMYKDADKRKKELAHLNEMEGGVIFKIKEDPRITKTGKLIRRMSIDELPQLYNVLKGDMSLVGPRPPVPGEVEEYEFSEIDRLKIKPGITCIWQVQGRNEIPFEQQVDLDRQYILSQSVWLDIKILFKTVSAVLNGRGAY